MANKKDIASLVNTVIMGGSTPDKAEDNIENKPVIPNKETKDSGSEMMVTSFRINKKTVRKLKMIAASSDTNMGSVVAAAFEMYIKKWESENGNPINI